MGGKPPQTPRVSLHSKYFGGNSSASTANTVLSRLHSRSVLSEARPGGFLGVCHPIASRFDSLTPPGIRSRSNRDAEVASLVSQGRGSKNAPPRAARASRLKACVWERSPLVTSLRGHPPLHAALAKLVEVWFSPLFSNERPSMACRIGLTSLPPVFPPLPTPLSSLASSMHIDPVFSNRSLVPRGGCTLACGRASEEEGTNAGAPRGRCFVRRKQPEWRRRRAGQALRWLEACVELRHLLGS